MIKTLQSGHLWNYLFVEVKLRVQFKNIRSSTSSLNRWLLTLLCEIQQIKKNSNDWGINLKKEMYPHDDAF